MQDGKDFWGERELSRKDQNSTMLWKLEIPGDSEEVPTLCTGKLFHTLEEHPQSTEGGREQKPQSVAVTAHHPQPVLKKKSQLEEREVSF